MKKNTLPQATLNFIDGYFQLPIMGKKIRCPYFKYKKKILRRRLKNRVFTGKGLPSEIAMATESLAKKQKKPLKNWTAEKIRDFMKKNGLGIDCSGFISWILNSWYQKEHKGKHIWRKINISLLSLKGMRYLLRPVENLDVKTIIRSKNCQPIKKVVQIKPGDLIHLGENHLLIITHVSKDSKNRVKSISYCHSSDFYDGVHRGKIEIKNFKAGLAKQRWIEKSKGQNWSFNEYLSSKKSGVVRLDLF